ncbi:NTP transferase domain-containing protein [Neobacillus vireti]|uniref:LicC protein n=1 Tax=Neobacillus vireti LMG 21834 TaxID=1131730 RepID=A0AB94IRF1_9BACI|nr:NTP transferase domain-containing protein [Neobacillus vireti]ETI69661.1 licC protein [Neobacillus vireti LMG 21834]KLT18249.1 CTP:phosphocholine cytidylyltransferase [Neobacillus vireti]
MRAILLAAGMGTRLRPLTLTTPKSLTVVNGKPMLEKQVEYLQEIGVEEIIVVTGYLAEKFEYLKEKYGITLVHNDKYEIYNNMYTMYLVREYLHDTYVIDADVYLHHNFLLKSPKTSMYFSARKPDFKAEWMIRYDEQYKVTNIEVGDGDHEYILCGVSYWSDEDGRYIVEKLEEAVESGNFKDFWWDEIIKNNLSGLNVHLQEIHPNDSYEIDSLEDLEKVNKLLAAGK